MLEPQTVGMEYLYDANAWEKTKGTPDCIERGSALWTCYCESPGVLREKVSNYPHFLVLAIENIFDDCNLIREARKTSSKDERKVQDEYIAYNKEWLALNVSRARFNKDLDAFAAGELHDRIDRDIRI